MLSYTGVNFLSSASGSKSQDNTKNDRIQQTPRKAKKNKIEEHLRTVRPSLNKKSVVDTKATSSVTNSMSNVNSDLKCALCNGCLFSDNHDACVVAYINSVNASIKSKSIKKPVNRRIWLAMTTIVPPREPIPIASNTDKPVITLVVQIVLWYMDYGCSKHMTGDHSKLINFVHKFLGTVKFKNDHVAKIMGYSDYQIGNVIISRVYYVEGLGHNLFFVGHFCDSDLEVAFRQHTCFIHNLDGVDLLTSSQGNNLYTLSLQDMMASLPICLLSKASKTKQGLVRGLPKLKFEKDHLCSACAMGKSMKKSHKPKSEDTNQEKLYLLHMDLCGPMRVESVNGKNYILVIIDDYSRFTCVKFLRSKKEALDFFIKFLRMIQVRLKVLVRRIQTDNGIEFVNQTLRDYYEEVDISHKTSVAHSPQQNGVVERRNRTLIETARTMLIYAQALLFLWAEAMATACFTQNRSIIRLRHGKIPYELLHNKLPDLSFFHMFGALCYPTNDSKNLGKLQPKADIGIFISYAPTKKAFRIYNRRTRRIVETIRVDFDEMTAMASEQSSSGPTLNEITPVIPQDVEEDNLDMEVAHMGNDPLFGIEALQEELNEFERLEVWELVPRPDQVMVITLKWIYKVKLDELGGILKNKACLVARGYRQEEGIDFEELKQALRAWYDMLSSFLLSQDLSKGSVDLTLFIRRNGNELLL
nr:retrovirus-related Pol polyprotein from transposon TNT 1-94 [Tanacetum cinerariifolium]